MQEYNAYRGIKTYVMYDYNRSSKNRFYMPLFKFLYMGMNLGY